MVVAGLLIFYKGYNGGYSWIKGDEGEKIVSLFLEDLPEGFFIFNDVKIPGGKGNIDHLVIGPTGIFVIETKNYSGYYKIEGNNWYLSRGHNDRLLKRNPSRQVKVNALDLANFFNSLHYHLELFIVKCCIKPISIGVKYVKPVFFSFFHCLFEIFFSPGCYGF